MNDRMDFPGSAGMPEGDETRTHKTKRYDRSKMMYIAIAVLFAAVILLLFLAQPHETIPAFGHSTTASPAASAPVTAEKSS